MNAYQIHSDTIPTIHAIRNVVRETATGIFANSENRAGFTAAGNYGQAGIWNRLTDTRPFYPYTLFNKSPLQLRRIGALGGKAYARNERARRALVQPPPAPIPLRAAPRQTTAQAIAALDAQFPWLRRVEKRRSRSQVA